MSISRKPIFHTFLLTCLIGFSVPSLAKEIKIKTKPIEHFMPESPEQTKFGNLKFSNGLELKSKDDNFGGLSGLRISKDGKTLFAVTDQGHYLKADLERDENSNIIAFKNAELSRLRNRKGDRIKGKREADAEALEIFGSQFIIGFERNHRVDFFNEKKNKLRADERAKTISFKRFDLPNNKGPEAIALSPKTNELFVFAEYALNDNKHHQGFIVKGEQIAPLSVTATDGYSLTDAHFLQNGDLIILERFYTPITGPAMRIRMFKRDVIKAGNLLKGEIIMQAKSQMEIDNMEGLAITEMADGSKRITLISDDNFSRNQRTLLLEFILTD